MTYLYVAPNARAVGVHAPGVPASSCVRRGCTAHASDWRARPGSAENTHRVGAPYERTSITDIAARHYRTEAHYVAYEMQRAGGPLEHQPRLCKDSLSWVRAEGFDVVLTALTADVDTPGHVAWTPSFRAAFDDLWARAPGPLATCGMYLSPKGYRLVQPLLVPLEVEAGERALAAWLAELVGVGVWNSALQVHDWTRHMRTPHHARNGTPIVSPWQDWARMQAVAVEAPTVAAPSRRPARRAQPRELVANFDATCPAGWEHVADQLGAALRDTVTSDWRRCYLALAGALLERSCPPSGVPAVIARAHQIDPQWVHLLGDRVAIAQTTVMRWASVDGATGERLSVLGYSALRASFPGVADALDGTTVTGAEARVLRQLARPAAPQVSLTEALGTITREIAQAYGVVAIEAPPGTGKTHAVIDRARHLPVIQERAAPGERIAVSAPRHDLAEQTAAHIPGALHLFSPPSLVRNGRPVCVYAESAKHLATGRQSVRRELCEGRGKFPCDAAQGCIAREGVEGDPHANLVVGVHGLVRDLRGYAGPAGTLVVDEPGEIVLTERVTLDDIETTARYLDNFTTRYATNIAPALAAFAAWVRECGAVDGPLFSIQGAVRVGAHAVDAALLDAADIDREHIEDAVLVAAADAIAADARSKAPPLEWRAVALARSNPARAAELGRASKLLDLLWRGITSRVAFGVRIDERSGERAATVVSINVDLVLALEHEGPVIVLDANASLHVPAITRVLGHAPKLVKVDVADGAPIARSILATNAATRRGWMPRGVPDWPTILPALRAALAWAEGCTSIALIAPKEMHVGFAYTLRPDDPATTKLVRESRVTRRTLDRIRAVLQPVLAAFRGTIITGHYQALEGLNHMADCDATITLSDPRPNLDDEAVKCEYLGLELDQRLDELAAAELGQAHGRLRTIHRKRPGRQLHVGSVVPSGWRQVAVLRLPGGRPPTVGAMTGSELRKAREGAGLGIRELARSLALSPSTLTRYESGTRAIPDDVARSVVAVVGSVPETPSREISYQGFREHFPSTLCSVPPPRSLPGVSGTPALPGVSGTPDDDGTGGGGGKRLHRPRRIDLASFASCDAPGQPPRAANSDWSFK
jgi:hypothetical protein